MTGTQADPLVIRIVDSPEHPVRLSYFYGFEGFKDKQDPKKIGYPAHFIFGPKHPVVAQVVAAMQLAANNQWGAKGPEMYEALKAKHLLCLKEGSVMKPGEEAYAGKLFIAGNAKKRFTIVGPDRTPVNSSDAFAPYSGAYGNGIIQVWSQDNSWGKRINAQIMGVQFSRHGESLGGGRIANPDDFGIVSAAGADGAAPAAAGNAAGLF